jgi:hypothetical protein
MKVQSGKVIVGEELDWRTISTLPKNSLVREQSKSVGLVYNPNYDKHCTGFIVGLDLIMTNFHCVKRRSTGIQFHLQIVGKSFSEDKERSPHYICENVEAYSKKWDYSVLRCVGDLGAKFGYLPLEQSKNNISKDDGLYLIQANCDFYFHPDCKRAKRVSYGKIMDWDPNASYRDRRSNIFYTNDTLKGSSGSPVISAITNKVVALHRKGHGDHPLGLGMGSSNSGTPMYKIVKHIKRRWPELDIDF